MTCDMLDLLEQENQEAIMCYADIEKGFDSVERYFNFSYLKKTWL